MQFGNHLYNFTAAGVTVFCDQWASSSPAPPEHEPPADVHAGPLHYLSLTGRPEAIRAIRAAILKDGHRSHASLQPRDPKTPHPYTSRNSPLYPLADHSVAVAQLPQPGLTHMVLARRDPAPDENGNFLIIARDPYYLPRMYLQVLTRHTSVIALPQWADFLWNMARERSWVTPSVSYNLHAWACETHETTLQREITNLLQQQALPIEPVAA